MKTENEEKKAKDQADIFKKSGRKKAVRDNTETRIVRVPVFSETKVATAEDIGESEQIGAQPSLTSRVSASVKSAKVSGRTKRVSNRGRSSRKRQTCLSIRANRAQVMWTKTTTYCRLPTNI